MRIRSRNIELGRLQMQRRLYQPFTRLANRPERLFGISPGKTDPIHHARTPLHPDGILKVMIPYSIYLHIPFCQKRCTYCDFNTYAGYSYLVPAYIQALCEEIQSLAEIGGGEFRVDTLFFGGGTPSLISTADLGRVLASLAAGFNLNANPEISLEANPGTLSLAYLSGLRSIGFNRLSLGVQSTHAGDLQVLGRQHDYPQVIQAVKSARQAGFENLSLDLIFDLPGQSLAGWEQNLILVLGLNPEHFSLYALTIEEGTLVQEWIGRGLISPQDPDLAAEMYELAGERLAQAGYRQYEISNWARPGYQCQHNLQYWRNLPYLGFGAGAHGFAGGYRTANVRLPSEYIRRLGLDRTPAEAKFPGTPATLEMNGIDMDTEMRETMMMGLRLTQEGVSAAAFKARFGVSLTEKFDQETRQMVAWGLLTWSGDILRLTPRGRLLGNRVFAEYI